MPAWFAEYCLYLAPYAPFLSVGICAYGLVVASTGRLAGMLKDASRSRRPTAIAAAGSTAIGFILIVIAVAVSDSHLRLATFALASLSLLLAIVQKRATG